MVRLGFRNIPVRTETSPPPGMRTLALEGFLDEDRRKLSGVEGGMFTASARAGRIEPSIGFIFYQGTAFAALASTSPFVLQAAIGSAVSPLHCSYKSRRFTKQQFQNPLP